MDNFVELRAFGFPDVEPRQTFPGHVHPDADFTHRWMYGHLGAEAMYAVLHDVMWLKWSEKRHQSHRSDPIEDVLETEYVKRHLPPGNYGVDKGWLHAVDHFAECIAEGKQPENADARDGLIAEKLAEATARSRRSGQPVSLK